MWLGLVLGFLTVARWLASWFSAESRLHRLELYYSELKARQAVEAERLEATYQRIAKEPPRPDQDAADAINERLRRLREQSKRERGEK